MNILIRAGGFSNKGAEAMMLTVKRELSRRIPGINFILRLPPQQAKMASSSGFVPVSIETNRFKKGFSLIFQALLRSEVRKALTKNVLGALELIDVKNMHGIIDISGFGYSDVWGVEPTERSLVWVKHCRKKGIPYVYMPQAWGPFNHPPVAQNVNEMCRHSSLVYARDEESLSHISDLSEESKNKVRMAPDIAFKFRGADTEMGMSVLKELGIEKGSYPLVGLTPNLRVYERMEGEGTNSSYVQLLTKIARFCIKKWNAAILLIPHEIALGQSSRKDDRFLCDLIHKGIADQGKVGNMNKDLTADTIKSVIGNLDLVIGSRFHSLVFALASMVPVVALGWTHKYGELVRNVGLDDFFLDLKSLDEGKVLGLVEKAWATRERSKEILSESIPRIGGKVDAVFDEVAEVLR